MVERLLAVVLLGLGLAPSTAWAQEPASPTAAALRVGHWVRAKGSFGPERSLVIEDIELRDPGDEHEIIGTVRGTREDDEDYAVLDVDGQPVFVGARCDLVGLDVSGLLSLRGQRIEVEGYWRSPWKFSARELELRDDGRDRLEGRIDAIERRGTRLVLSIMGFDATVGRDHPLDADKDVADYGFADEIDWNAPSNEALIRDDDDDIRGRLIAPGLWFGSRAEWRLTDEQDFDLDDTRREDRTDQDANVRGELNWQPSDRFFALVEYRHAWRRRFDQDDGPSRSDEGRINEAYVYVRDVGMAGLDLQLGRQDFDETREWLYDENLDGARLLLDRASMHVEAFAATTLAGGRTEEEETNTYALLVSTATTSSWSVGGYALHRERSGSLGRSATHLGLRGLGEFVDGHESWAELAMLRGDEQGTSLGGWAFDVGDTWSPAALDDWYFTLGYAYGSGDDDLSDGRDGTFRQTGLHDNNGKLGGVTSFRYYGELLDPELANLSVATVGFGKRFGKRDSIDVLFHKYAQDVLSDSLVDAQIDSDPSGLDDDLGWELDIVYGSRSHDGVDLELVLGRFEPGAAFPGADTAWLAKIQVRLQL